MHFFLENKNAQIETILNYLQMTVIMVITDSGGVYFYLYTYVVYRK